MPTLLLTSFLNNCSCAHQSCMLILSLFLFSSSLLFWGAIERIALAFWDLVQAAGNASSCWTSVFLGSIVYHTLHFSWIVATFNLSFPAIPPNEYHVKDDRCK